MARDFELQSRDEEILAATIDGTEYTDEPQSRIEYLLLELKELIEGGGSPTDYATDINFSMDSGTFVITAQLKNKDGDPLGTAKTVDIPLEATVVGGSYNAQTKTLILTLVSGQTISIPIGDIISGLQAEITAQNPLDADLVDDSTASHKFVTTAEKAQIATNTSDISSLSSGKVDKVTGKGLSTNDYTTAEKNKLAGLNNYDDTEVRGLIAENASDISDIQDTIGDINTVLEEVL